MLTTDIDCTMMIDEYESDEIIIDDVKFSMNQPIKMNHSEFHFSNVYICEVALLRRIIMANISTIRLELVPKDEKISIENI